jgi:hypothetical protein
MRVEADMIERGVMGEWRVASMLNIKRRGQAMRIAEKELRCVEKPRVAGFASAQDV